MMSCLNKKCAITKDDETMITCWLCDGLCHVKCSGLSGIIADSLLKDNGLHWCCNACRKISVSFYRFFKGTKKQFLEMQEEASKLSEKISAYGKLFEDYKCLDSIKSPVQSSPKRRKSSRKNNKEKPENAHLDCVVSVTPLNSNTPTSSINCNSDSNSAFALSKNVTTEVLNYAFNNITASTHANNIPINNLNYAEVLTNKENNPHSHRELRVIPPKKQIFISRFAIETSADDIDFYIKSKLNQNVDIAVHKFNYSQPRIITSFKITVPFDLFDRVVDTSFWPHHVIVREFKYDINNRPSNVAHLQPRQVTGQKN